MLVQVGRLDEAIAEIRRARELDPLSLIINADLGWMFYLARRFDESVEQLRKTLELDSNFIRARYLLGRSYLQKSMYTEATTELHKASDLSGRNAVYLAGLGCGHAASGRIDEAVGILNELQNRLKSKYVPSYDIALVCISLGRSEEAFTWLDRAFKERSDFKDELRMGAILDPLRSDARYKDLLRRVGL